MFSESTFSSFTKSVQFRQTMGSTSINLQITRFEQIQPPYQSSFPHSTIYSQENVYSLPTRNRISFRDRGFSDLYHDINVTYLYNQVFMHVGPLSAVNYSNYYTRIGFVVIKSFMIHPKLRVQHFFHKNDLSLVFQTSCVKTGTILASLDTAEHLLVGHGFSEESSHLAPTF